MVGKETVKYVVVVLEEIIDKFYNVKTGSYSTNRIYLGKNIFTP